MDVKIFDFGTLNETDRPFILEDNEFSVAENIMRSTSGDVVTRSGFLERVTLPSNVVEVVYYRSKDEFVVFSNPSNNDLRIDIYNATTFSLKRYYSYNHPSTGSQRDISQFGNIGQIQEINYTEFQNNLYFIYVVGGTPFPMLKYDGYVIRMTGLPEPEGVSTSGTGYDYRLAYKTYDFNGNITYGPYHQVKNVSSVTGVLSLTSYIGYNKYCYQSIAPISSGLDVSNRTLTGLSHNYKAGDFMMIFSGVEMTRGNYSSPIIMYPLNREYVILEVESVEISTITFTASSLNGVVIDNTFSISGTAYDTQSRVTFFGTTTGKETYQLVPAEYLVSGLDIISWQESFVIKTSGGSYPLSASYSYTSSFKQINADLIYDFTTFKYRPPLCRYVTAYGDQLAFGNIFKIWAELNQEIIYNNNDLIMYSDSSDGDYGEGISRVNRQIIGESFDGSVTGLVRVKDSLIITKENSIFSIDGILESGGYTLRRIETNNVGCSSHKSILQVEGGIIFHGNDGLYFSNSYNAKKITQKLDSFFDSSIDLTKTRSAINNSLNHYYFLFKKGSENIILVFDYSFKRWFKWKGVNGSFGLVNRPNGKVFFSDSIKIYELGASQSDNGVAILSKIRTKFFDLANLSVIKKFIRLRILDMVGGGDLSVSIYKDWNNVEIVSSGTVSVDKKTKQKYIPLTNGYSCAVEIKNNTSDMNISGLIFEIEPWQMNDRNN